MISISGAKFAFSARIALAAVVVLALVSGAEAAEVPSTATQLFEDARAEMKRGDFATARDKLIESLRLEQTVGTLFNLGLCEERLGLLRDSLQHLKAAQASADDADRRRPVMAALIESLDRRVPRVVLKRTKAPARLQVTFDGGTVDATPDGRELLANPGEHEIVVRGPAGASQTMTIRVNEGETVVTLVEWRAEPAIDTPAERPPVVVGSLPPPGDGLLRQRLGAVAVNAGGAAVIAGVVLGYMTMGKKISVDYHCGGGSCDEEGLRAAAQGASYSTASTAVTVAGLAGLGIGAYALRGQRTASPEQLSARERALGYVAGSVGAAALVASAIAGGAALSAKRELLDRCGDAGPCGDSQGLDAAARGRTAATIATVALGVGVAGLGVASYSLLVRPRFASTTAVRVTLSPSAIACAASF